MYYKSVNRGLMFTKAGVYCIGYVMMLGLLAIISGANALYLFLSTGMALLIVSGLLSERVMRYNNVTRIEKKTVNAESAFTIAFVMQNHAKKFTTFGIETHFLFQRPKVKIISHPVQAPISGTALKVAPGKTETFQAHCTGLTRGYHQKVISYQKTGYPFGFLEKFKFHEIDCELVVAPALDRKLLEDLMKNLATIKRQNEDEQDFFGHRSYSTLDSLRYVDWRRSASKAPKDWVIKQFRAETDIFQFCVRLDPAELLQAQSEQSYESLLSRTMTAIEAVDKSGFRVIFQVGNAGSLSEMPVIMRLLADTLPWQARSGLESQLSAFNFTLPQTDLPYIHITLSGYKLISAPKRGQAS